MTLKNKSPLSKIIEVCEIQMLTVKISGKPPCKDEFRSLMKVIQGWAKQAEKSQVKTDE